MAIGSHRRDERHTNAQFTSWPGRRIVTGVISHIVMFRFADKTDIEPALHRLRGMAGKVPAMRSVRAGRNGNTGPHAFDLVLVTEHDDQQGLADYLADPQHREVATWLRDRISDRAVVDTADLTG